MAFFTPRLARLRSLPVAALFLGLSFGAQAQTTAPTPIVVSSATAIYTQNFDAMGVSGASSTEYPAGWTGLRFAKSATATTVVGETLPPVVVLAGSTSGAVYNAGPFAGSANDTDRALGSLGSGSTIPAFGAVFRNQTGAAVTRVNIAARNEQWRTGSNETVNEIMEFEYSLDATSLITGTWTAVTNLNLSELALTSTSAGPLDGNAAGNFSAITGTITLNWPNNTNMWIRWKDADNTGSDALMAVDNFALSTGTTTLGNRNAAKASTVSLFPNPAADVVTIRTSNGRKADVTVTDLMGRTVLTGATAVDGTFNTSSLKAGSYLFIVNDGEATSTHKVSKQ